MTHESIRYYDRTAPRWRSTPDPERQERPGAQIERDPRCLRSALCDLAARYEEAGAVMAFLVAAAAHELEAARGARQTFLERLLREARADLEDAKAGARELRRWAAAIVVDDDRR